MNKKNKERIETIVSNAMTLFFILGVVLGAFIGFLVGNNDINDLESENELLKLKLSLAIKNTPTILNNLCKVITNESDAVYGEGYCYYSTEWLRKENSKEGNPVWYSTFYGERLNITETFASQETSE